ncbi:hypothetical protein H072_75 [Dactylellina haptotyla CBS 200.50]|uniref:Uncharacterized protein n=1 Tax=Dactylellina haptotyla (strain CBS 200.50) TaxID=1284197 RepID=S8ASH1_DACHA|nr:hypothetical protein H072_75 [Dactylellina haptotyla CBS 200.50]
METILPSQLKQFLAAQETTLPRPFFETAPKVLTSIRIGSILMFLLYVYILLSYASRGFKSYRKGNRDTIIIHALSGLSELTSFYFPVSKATSVPLSAVILCSTQCATNMLLVRQLGRGNPALVRPVYQAGAIFRMAFIIAAYLSNSQSLYHDSVVIIHAFAYTRLICFLFTTASGFSETEVPEYDAPRQTTITFAQTYTAAVYGSALVVMGQMQSEGAQRYAAVAFLVAVGVVMRVENWVTEAMKKIEENKMQKRDARDYIACGLYTLGFCRLSVLLEMDRKMRA